MSTAETSWAGDGRWRWWFSSVTQLCLTLCNRMNHSMPGLPVHPQLPESTQTYVYWDDDAIQPSQPLSSLLLLPSIFPSIRVFSNESALRIRWPKHWSFSLNISPSNEHPGLISLRMTSFQSKGLSRVFSNTTVQKHQFFGAQLSLYSNSHIHTWLLEKPLAPELWPNHKQLYHYFIRKGADRHWGVSLIVHHSAI